jgi:ubiquinone/menaquinone biosynthesis C-methylase UbiE
MVKKGSVLLCLVLFAAVFMLQAAEQKPGFEVEDWEKGLNKRQPPLPILDAIGAKPGMVIGELGAGTGRMTMWLAERIGPDGKIYANDINKNSLNHLKARCKKANFKNVTPILGGITDPKFPKKTLDLVFMINVYHHLDKPVETVRNIIPSLKPDGLMAIVDCDPLKSGFGDDHSTPIHDFILQMNEAGYRVIRIESFLNEDYIYICRPKAGSR